ncbi:MAG: hypothetical protein GY754_40955 [bacterium]|nr:hypothetical protein [bacterium]
MKKILQPWLPLLVILVLAFTGCEQGIVTGSDSGSGAESGGDSGFSFSDMYSRMNTMEKEIISLKNINHEQTDIIIQQGILIEKLELTQVNSETGLDGRIQALEGNVGSVSIGTLNDDVFELKTNIGAVSIGTLNSDLSDLKANIGSVSISNLDSLTNENAAAISDLSLKNSPIGTILAWQKDLPGMPDIPEGWVECNGNLITDEDSPLYGQNTPDLNGQKMFLRGGTQSNIFQEDQFESHNHGGKTGFGVDISGTNAARDYANCGSGHYPHYVYNYNCPTYANFLEGHKHTIGSDGGEETRPVNMSVIWIMRIK